MSLIELRRGDITTATTDAIVTSVSPSLTVSGGVNAAIHVAAGEALTQAVRAVGDADVGTAFATSAGALAAAHVIHAVTPRWKNGHAGELLLLTATHEAALRAAQAEKLRSIAIPSIGSGANGFPVNVAAEVALKAATAFLDSQPDGPRKIEYWLDSLATYAAYAAALERLATRHRRATRADYWFDRLGEEPTSATRPLGYERRVDPLEADFIAAGLIAQEMEEKWFVYELDGRVHCHRSWTGFEVFSFRLRPLLTPTPGAIVDQVHVCTDESRYSADEAEAREQLDKLVTWLASGAAYG
jgi:O-acetyl-ADP-ribose deacetylase (regulator of RNase III)